MQNTTVAKEMDMSLTSATMEKKSIRDKRTQLQILDGGIIKKVQRARQRKILSCVYCHSKKIKCSRTHPICTVCEKLNIECKYFINERVSRGGKVTARLSAQERKTRGLNKETTPRSVSESDGLDIISDIPGSLSSSELSQSPENDDLMDYSIQMTRSAPSSITSGTTLSDSEYKDGFNDESKEVVSEMALNYLNCCTTTKEQQQLLKSMPADDQLTKDSPISFETPESSADIFNRGFMSQKVIQTPIFNTMSNNITNSFFKNNFTVNSQPQQKNGVVEVAPPGYSLNTLRKNFDDSYSFNLSSFTFVNQDNAKGSSETIPNVSGMIVNDQSAVQATPAATSKHGSTSSNQLSNPGLNNSLNSYPSNPATTVNYLYGTNTYYENDYLLEDLAKHLPEQRRSYELIDRYINSVHLLLPIIVNLDDFLNEHKSYWEISAGMENSSAHSSQHNDYDFNYLQFYTLYFPILYAATISEFEEYDNLLLNQDIDRYLRGFNKICQYYNYPHGIKIIPLLLGNVIIQSTSPNPSTMEMSQIIRYAKFLQFHKDPVITLRISDWEVVKFRRLLWWVIFGLDALTAHNFCLPPVCTYNDFNVVMPEEEEPIFDHGVVRERKLNVSVLSLNIKFNYDRILSTLVYLLHNGLSSNITQAQITEISDMIIQYYMYIHNSMNKMNEFYKVDPPTTVQEMNLINFIKNHSFSFVDRAMMLLHKKILFGDDTSNEVSAKQSKQGFELNVDKNRGGVLSLSQYEDTFGHIQEANIIKNFNNSSISLLKFNPSEDFSYGNMHNNLIPSILHNLNDFLKYNDFIKFGKYNWYIKRTIPLDSIILMFIIITVKFKYEFFTINELCIYVKLINKALFILNRKWFKNEKYKRMLSLTNLTWEYILKRYNIVQLINQFNDEMPNNRIEFFDYQVKAMVNMNELFDVMDVPQPIDFPYKSDAHGKMPAKRSHYLGSRVNNVSVNSLVLNPESKLELAQLNEKIYYDLRNNFVDVNDYCAFYTSLENILHELMDFMNQQRLE